MPAEREPHLRTWMFWPCRAGLWPDIAATRRAFAQVAEAIAAFEPVIMAARPEDLADVARAGLDGWSVPLDDSWARDSGPTFLRGASVQWRFNAWGGKYQPFDQDARFATRVAQKEGLPVRAAPLVCEGGAIHSDGQGMLLTTEQCLLNPNRNPGMSREAVTSLLCEFTGAERMVWLGSGFSDSETDGHVDNIACFIRPGRVLVGVPDSKSHPDHAPVMEAIARLKNEGLDIVELVQPRTIRHDRRGRLLQASYINFALCNGGLVMPAFDDPHDEPARALLADCFPERIVTVVPALDIVAGGGGIHCITQQQPV